MFTLSYIMGYFTGCINAYIWFNYNDLYSKLQNDALLLGYNGVKIYTDIKEWTIIKDIEKYYKWWYDINMYYFYDKHFEPIESEWTYSCFIRKNIKNFKLELVEQYNKLLDTMLVQSTMANMLYIIKHENSYIVKYSEMPQKELYENKTLKRKSKCGFLSVEYSHPKLVVPIELDINKNMFIDGNHLFTPEFVLRCLKYQNKTYYFDLNYKLNLLDNNINNVVLDSKRYIELNEKSYIIHTID